MTANYHDMCHPAVKLALALSYTSPVFSGVFWGMVGTLSKTSERQSGEMTVLSVCHTRMQSLQ